MEKEFLPTNKKEIKALGIKQVDFIIVTGDAYVDHPSFGTSLIARYLQSFNYTVAILAQPKVSDDNSYLKCGKPKYAFLVSSGNIDSMVNHYYTSKQPRKKDVYSPNDKANKRPDYATSVYSNDLKRIFGDIPVIIGGIEASLRRLSHYDYWQDKLLPSILISSNADLLVYSMGEKAIIEIADYLASGLSIKDLTFINGTCFVTNDITNISDALVLPSYESLVANKQNYADSFLVQYNNNEHQGAQVLIEPYQNLYIVQNIPQPTISNVELDHLYDLPFTYESYDEYHFNTTISALTEIKFSINVNRGCNGGCNFCAITFHQGKQISMRNLESCVNEAKLMSKLDNYKGYIHDVGGPTANFNDEICDKLVKYGSCKHRECYAPTMCPNVKVSHQKYFEILRALRQVDGVKKVFVRSGIRYDYFLKEKNPEYLEELVKYHVSGQLRLAPEHYSDNALKYMNKPSIKYYDSFVDQFNQINTKLDLKQFVVPYLMSSHPGTTLADALQLALYLKSINYKPVQVQDFYPTPSTMSTVMYYTNINPKTMEKVYIPRSEKDKQLQRALLQYHLPQNYDLVYEALTKLNRLDLVGINGLIKPKKGGYNERKYK